MPCVSTSDHALDLTNANRATGKGDVVLSGGNSDPGDGPPEGLDFGGRKVLGRHGPVPQSGAGGGCWWSRGGGQI